MALLLVACAEPAADHPVTVERTDSAGVERVVSSGPAAPDSITFQLRAPVLDLTETADSAEFHQVRALLPLEDGVVVTEDTRLLAFDGTGRLRWSWDREGDGPMEFHRLRDLHLRGDTVVAFPRSRSAMTSS